jgi:N utilization substance protein A
MRGSRINNIVHELNDEKIDIIQWSPDPAEYVSYSLSPVKPLKVSLRDTDHTAIVTVPEKQLSLAIGKDGQNARLAARLTGWRVDVAKPAEGEVFDEAVLETTREPVSSYARRNERGNGGRSERGGRGERGDRSERGNGGRGERGERGERGGRSNHRNSGGNRRSYGYDDE